MASETINMCLQNPKNSKCRACLSEENLLSLFSHGLSVKIMKLADIKIYEGDGLPSTICIDCEVEVKRCYNFVAQIKRADAKLREMLENNEDSSEISENEEDLKENGKSEEASASQIDIEELNIKQEALDSFIDEKQEKMSDTDHAHYDDVPDTIGDENKLNPLNQVDIVVDPLGGEGMDVAIDPLGQEEPLIDSNKIYCEPAIDPLTFVKVEGVAMDVDKVDPFVPDAGPSGSSCTTVNISEAPINILRTLLQSKRTTKQRIKKCGRPQKNKHTLRKSPIFNQDYSLQDFTKAFENKNCIMCSMNFNSVESLKDHREMKQVVCRVCAVVFQSHYELEKHFLTHNTRTIRCRVCREQFYTRKDHTKHKAEMHTASKNECKTCRKIFTTLYCLQKHIKHFHDEIEENCECAICGKKYKRSFQLKQHMSRYHEAYENIECKFCHTIYSGPVKLRAHIKSIHLDSIENTPVTCSTCGKVCNSASILVRHLETHENFENVCNICGKHIKTKGLMRRHMKILHSKNKTFSCKICNEQFDLKKSLQTHQRKHHPSKESTNVTCDICSKEFKSMWVLNLHKVRHSDEKLFKCEICDATFKLELNLRTHMRGHNPSGFKYDCRACNTTFKWKLSYYKHLNKCLADKGKVGGN